MVAAYKNLARVERDFRPIKSDDLDLRPVFHYLEERIKAHVLICTLAAYLTWHLRQAWAPLTFTDEYPPAHGYPVAPRPPIGPRPGLSLLPARSHMLARRRAVDRRRLDRMLAAMAYCPAHTLGAAIHDAHGDQAVQGR